MGDTIYIISATTGVKHGGTVRAVVKLGATFEMRGYFNYCDTNTTTDTPEGQKMQWAYGRARFRGDGSATRTDDKWVWGWVPLRAVEGAGRLKKCAGGTL